MDHPSTSETCFWYTILRILQTGVLSQSETVSLLHVIHYSFILTPCFNGPSASISSQLDNILHTIVHERVSQRINCNSSLLWHYFTIVIYLRSYVTYVDPTMVSFVMTVIQPPSKVTFLKFFRHDNHTSIKRNSRKVFETLIIESFLDVSCFCQSS